MTPNAETHQGHQPTSSPYRRPAWALRLILFLGLIATLFLPWYRGDSGDVGSGWVFMLEVAGWTLGLCFLPFLALSLSALPAILRPKGLAEWPYRASLLLWLAYAGLSIFADTAETFTGPIASFLTALLAAAVELWDIVSRRRGTRQHPVTVTPPGDQQNAA